LVGSNFSKNGTPWDVTNEGVKTLFSDVRAGINVDPKRIYTAGFSGGSRVACTIAVMDGGIAGVIGCAAGFPQVQPAFQNKFDYFGIVGEYDFNLTEMKQWDEMLAQNGFSHQLLTTGSIHGWASARDFETALLWMQVNAMKEHLQPKNDTLVQALKKDFDKRISIARSSGEWISTSELMEGVLRTLDGLTDVTTYRKQLSELENETGYKNAVTLQAKLQPEESAQQQELQKQFAEQDEKWWAKKITSLNNNIRQYSNSAKTKQEMQMNKRLLNYLGLVGYMYTDHALKTGDLAHAETFLKVFKMADPENPDCGYLSAIYFMQKGDAQKAIASLNEAASLGYNDVGQLTTDPAFKSLHNDAGYKQVMNRVKEN